MQKVNLIYGCLIMALIFSISSCDAQKRVPKKTQQTTQQPTTPIESDIQRQIREEKEQLELDKIRNERAMLQIKQEQAEAALREQAIFEAGTRKLLIPCTKEALELEKNNQMAAQGMSTGKERQELALKDANRVAIAELMTRFVGVIKNGIEDYTKDTDTKNLSRVQEAQLEGLCINVCEKAINEYFKPACREFVQDKKGTYGCYVAIYVSTNKVLDEIDKALEVAEVDVDKAMFRKRLQAELDAQSRKEQEAKQADLERLKALQSQANE